MTLGELSSNWCGVTYIQLQGGAIHATNEAKVQIRTCMFASNQASKAGGALDCDRKAQASIHNSTFRNNKVNTANLIVPVTVSPYFYYFCFCLARR